MAEYFISEDGDDLASGTSEGSPWKTLTPLNELTQGAGLKGGDAVYFQRGSRFTGTLYLPTQNDGTQANPVRIADYGSGNLPVISGHKTVSNWVSVGNGRYESVDAEYPAYIQMLQINGVNRPKIIGRSQVIRYNGTVTTLVSDNLPNYDYSGGQGEVIVEKNPFIVDKCRIIGRSGNTLTITNPNTIEYSTRELYKFTIQNLVETLQEDGDWMYNSVQKKLTIYSPSANPNTRNIRVSVTHNLVNAVGNQWNELMNIQFEGANDEAIRFDTSHFIKVDSIIVRDTGLSGIGLWTAQNGSIINSKIINSYCTGIQQRNNSLNFVIENNEIEDVYPFFGSGGSGDARGFGIFGGDSDTIIRNNRVMRAGYVGIRFGGNNTLVEHNLVDGYCMVKHDGGGIYSYGGNAGQNTYVNRIVRRNIVIGKPGADLLDASVAYYTDDNQDNVVYEDNLAINTPDAGLYNHNSQLLTHSKNIIFGAGCAKLFIHNPPNEEIRLNQMQNQEYVLLQKDETPYIIRTDIGSSDFPQYGTIDNNLFILCSHNEFIAAVRWVVSGKRFFHNYTLSQWRALGFDLNSEIRYLDIPEYDIQAVGPNKFQGDGTFQSGSTAFTSIFYEEGTAVRDIDTTSKVSGTHSLRAYSPVESAKTTRIQLSFTQLGAIESGKAYVCRFKTFAPSGHQSLNCYFTLVGWPYTRLTREWHFSASDDVREYEFVLVNFRPCPNASFTIDFQSNQGQLFISDFEFREIISGSRTLYESHIRPVFNISESTEDVDLPTGMWVDVTGNPLGSSVNLDAFKSMIALYVGENPDPDPDPEPTPVSVWRGKRFVLA